MTVSAFLLFLQHFPQSKPFPPSFGTFYLLVCPLKTSAKRYFEKDYPLPGRNDKSCCQKGIINFPAGSSPFIDSLTVCLLLV